jgi:hypothetical protein
MLRISAFFISIFVAVGTPANAEETASIYEFCRDRWNGNMRMRDYCEEQQESAREAVRGNRYSDEAEKTCRNRWSENHVMFKYCLEKSE